MLLELEKILKSLQMYQTYYPQLEMYPKTKRDNYASNPDVVASGLKFTTKAGQNFAKHLHIITHDAFAYHAIVTETIQAHLRGPRHD